MNDPILGAIWYTVVVTYKKLPNRNKRREFCKKLKIPESIQVVPVKAVKINSYTVVFCASDGTEYLWSKRTQEGVWPTPEKAIQGFILKSLTELSSLENRAWAVSQLVRLAKEWRPHDINI